MEVGREEEVMETWKELGSVMYVHQPPTEKVIIVLLQRRGKIRKEKELKILK